MDAEKLFKIKAVKLKEEAFWIIGMMSGTSLDGVDVAAIKTDGISVFEIGPGQLYPYSQDFSQEIKNVLGAHEYTPYIRYLEKRITKFHADAYDSFLKEFRIASKDICLIGFHGQTILHQSPKKTPEGRTWQLGDGQMLADLTQIPVVANMRQNDVYHGGEGAPLVPVYHQALMKGLPKPVAILNVGGVANITWIDEDSFLACDVGPGNALLNDWMYKNTNLLYDEQGKCAAKGIVDESIVKKFLIHPYFSITAPKSLDRNEFSLDMIENLSLENGAATLTEITAACVKESEKLLPEMPKTWYVAGGGRHNITLLQRLEHHLKPANLKSIDVLGNDGDMVEAQAFAFLAMRSVKKMPLTFPTTTGVHQPLSGGILYLPY